MVKGRTGRAASKQASSERGNFAAWLGLAGVLATAGAGIAVALINGHDPATATAVNSTPTPMPTGTPLSLTPAPPASSSPAPATSVTSMLGPAPLYSTAPATKFTIAITGFTESANGVSGTTFEFEGIATVPPVPPSAIYVIVQPEQQSSGGADGGTWLVSPATEPSLDGHWSIKWNLKSVPKNAKWTAVLIETGPGACASGEAVIAQPVPSQGSATFIGSITSTPTTPATCPPPPEVALLEQKGTSAHGVLAQSVAP